MPAPALMTSVDPPPSMVSTPLPVVMLLTAEDPVTVKLLPTALESRFWKFRTEMLSPPVMSVPAAAARLTLERPETERTIRVLLPVPPSMETSAPQC